MDFLINIFPVIFLLMFALVFGTILVSLFRELGQWNKNNHSPRLTVLVKVLGKRQDFRRRSNRSLHNMHYSTHATTYFVTFQVESGDRMELQVPGGEYGMLIEGDQGKLTFQGTRFLTFERM